MNRENSLLAGISPEVVRHKIVDLTEKYLGRELPTAAAAELALYVEQVAAWGTRVDLVAPRSLQELLELSIVDAAVLARAECELGSPADQIVDVGSGGGAPGLPLAILLRHLRGDSAFTLVEPRTKRVAFLRSIAGQLGGTPPTVLRARSDVLSDASFDVALARATLPPPAWLEEGARLSRHAVWVLLAREPVPHKAGLRRHHERQYQLPFSGARRSAVRFVHDAETGGPCASQEGNEF